MIIDRTGVLISSHFGFQEFDFWEAMLLPLLNQPLNTEPEIPVELYLRRSGKQLLLT